MATKSVHSAPGPEAEPIKGRARAHHPVAPHAELVMHITRGHRSSVCNGEVQRIPPAEEACLEIAREQYGVISREQALGCGLSAFSVRCRVKSGRWEELFPRSYCVSGSSDSWRRELSALCLATRGVAWARSAAALYGLDGFPAREIEVLTTGKGIPKSMLGLRRVHRTGYLPEEDIAEIYGIHAASPARTLLGLGAVARPRAVGRAVDDALNKGLVTLPVLRALLARAGCMGRPGTAVFREILGGYGETVRTLPHSELESLMLEILDGEGFPPPFRQYEVRENGHVLGRLDACYPDELIALEADGYEWHSAKPDWLRDRRRQNALVSRGWRVLRFTRADAERPAAFLSDLVRLRKSARNSSGAA